MGAGASAGTGKDQPVASGATRNQYEDCPSYEVTASRTLCVPPSLRGKACKLVLGKEALVVADRKAGNPIVLFPYYRILSWGSNFGSVQFRVVVTDKPKRKEVIDPLSPPKNPPCNNSDILKGGFLVYHHSSSRKVEQSGAGQEESAPGKEKAEGNAGGGDEKAKRDDSTDEARGEKKPPPPPPPPEVTLQKQKTVTIAFLTHRGKDIETKIMSQVKLLMSKMDSKGLSDEQFQILLSELKIGETDVLELLRNFSLIHKYTARQALRLIETVEAMDDIDDFYMLDVCCCICEHLLESESRQLVVNSFDPQLRQNVIARLHAKFGRKMSGTLAHSSTNATT